MRNKGNVGASSTTCAMTVDVEDFFQVSAFANAISHSDWSRFPLRVEKNTQRLLELFNANNAKATFFTLGWVAEKCPGLIRDIVAEGHEIASHGYMHEKVTSQTPSQFKNDVSSSKSRLEDISGQRVLGYRAPSFSIDPSSEWAFAILAELGFVYSSSTYPVEHDHYGAPNWPRSVYRRPEGIFEIPIPTHSAFGKNIPIGGGGFFRLYPYRVSNALINRYLASAKQPYSFYFHPWEIDGDQPKVSGISMKSRFRHYLNLNRMEARLEQLLEDYSWNTMAHVFQLDGQFDNEKAQHQIVNA